MRPALDLFFSLTDDQLTFAEFWAYYETFITELLPVAESANVKLSVHPNDPPGVRPDGATLGGVGIAVSASSKYVETAVDYCRWVAPEPMINQWKTAYKTDRTHAISH